MGIVKAEVSAKGGITNVLLMKDEDGKINWQAIGIIYSALFITMVSVGFMVKDAFAEVSPKKS